MILDSEKQKTQLLQLIKAVPIQGSFEQLKQTVAQLSELEESLQKAVIGEVRDGDT